MVDKDGSENGQSVGRAWRLIVGGAALAHLAVLGLYWFSFRGHSRSSNPEMWAAFGDYMGGVLGPVLGLLTIILLVQTLRQTDEALAQSREELRLTRDELKRGLEIQEKTEKALGEQIAIARRTATFERMVTLTDHYNKEAARLKQEYEACFESRHGTGIELYDKAYCEQKRNEAETGEMLREQFSMLLQDRGHLVVKDFKENF